MSKTQEDPQPAPVSKKNKYRKDKPWDTDDIDKWKIEPFQEGEMKAPLLEESTFATLFPRYKEQYLRDVWPEIQQALEPHGILGELNLVEGTMTVKTTRKTWDPYMIIKARDLIRLLSRGVPAPQAVKILGDEITCDIIKIGGLVRNKDRFVKRRQRLMGPNGETLKALELLTNCYIFIQGNTVSAMGTFKNLKILRRIVVDCMENVHPIYHIKTLMIKKELEKDPELAKENWDRFLPQFKKKNLKRKSANKTEKKAPYTPFPPAPVMSKIDKQLESGEYFLSPEQKQAKDLEAKTQKSAEKKKIRTEKYNEGFVPPKEPVKSNAKVPKTVETRSASDIAASLLQKTGSKRGRPQEEAQVAAEPKSKIQKTDRDGSKKRRK